MMIPGFTAEAALYSRSGHYDTTGTGGAGRPGSITSRVLVLPSLICYIVCHPDPKPPPQTCDEEGMRSCLGDCLAKGQTYSVCRASCCLESAFKGCPQCS
jgi:hypothetical protein